MNRGNVVQRQRNVHEGLRKDNIVLITASWVEIIPPIPEGASAWWHHLYIQNASGASRSSSARVNMPRLGAGVFIEIGTLILGGGFGSPFPNHYTWNSAYGVRSLGLDENLESGDSVDVKTDGSGVTGFASWVEES